MTLKNIFTEILEKISRKEMKKMKPFGNNNNFKTDIYTFLNSKYNEIFNNIENNLSQEKIENDITKFFKAEYSKFCNQVNSKEHFEIFYKFYPKNIFKF